MKKEIEWTVQRAPGISTVYYTTGAKKYCGKEVELKLPLAEEDGLGILNRVVSFCKETAHEFTEGEEINGLLAMPVKVIERMPTTSLCPKDTVYQIVLPDNSGKFPEDEGCNPIFKNQIKEDGPRS